MSNLNRSFRVVKRAYQQEDKRPYEVEIKRENEDWEKMGYSFFELKEAKEFIHDWKLSFTPSTEEEVVYEEPWPGGTI